MHVAHLPGWPPRGSRDSPPLRVPCGAGLSAAAASSCDPLCKMRRSERAGYRGLRQARPRAVPFEVCSSVPKLGCGSAKACLPKAGVLMWSGEIAVTLRGRKTPFISSGKDKRGSSAASHFGSSGEQMFLEEWLVQRQHI